MAVIVTDMKMPDTCHECKYKKCYFYNKVWTTIDGKKEYRTSRNDICPLKSVESLITEIYEKYMGYAGKEWNVYMAAMDCIEIIREYCGGEYGNTCK